MPATSCRSRTASVPCLCLRRPSSPRLRSFACQGLVKRNARQCRDAVLTEAADDGARARYSRNAPNGPPSAVRRSAAQVPDRVEPATCTPLRICPTRGSSLNMDVAMSAAWTKLPCRISSTEAPFAWIIRASSRPGMSSILLRWCVTGDTYAAGADGAFGTTAVAFSSSFANSSAGPASRRRL